jgi:hypothetical protein
MELTTPYLAPENSPDEEVKRVVVTTGLVRVQAARVVPDIT